MTTVSDEIDHATPYDSEQASIVILNQPLTESETMNVPDGIIQHQSVPEQGHINSRDQSRNGLPSLISLGTDGNKSTTKTPRLTLSKIIHFADRTPSTTETRM